MCSRIVGLTEILFHGKEWVNMITIQNIFGIFSAPSEGLLLMEMTR